MYYQTSYFTWFDMIQLYSWYSGELRDNENGYIWIIFMLFLMACIIDAYLSKLYKWTPNRSSCTSSCWDIQVTVQWYFNYENIAEDSNLTNNIVLGIYQIPTSHYDPGNYGQKKLICLPLLCYRVLILCWTGFQSRFRWFTVSVAFLSKH